VEAAYQRYVVKPVGSQHEIWMLRHPVRLMGQGKTLRLILPAEAVVVWSADEWKTTSDSKANHFDDLNLWFVDLPTTELAAESQIEFTFSWTRDQRWEGRNFRVQVMENAPAEQSTQTH
jgi:glucoamylase